MIQVVQQRMKLVEPRLNQFNLIQPDYNVTQIKTIGQLVSSRFNIYIEPAYLVWLLKHYIILHFYTMNIYMSCR
jgi:hypothetical protein